MPNYASSLIKIAIDELGYKEKASNKDLYDKTANAGSGNYTKYAYEINKDYPNLLNGNKQGCAYCAIFVLWCSLKVFGYDNTRKMLSIPEKSAAAGVTYLYAYMKKANKVGKTPRVGSFIIFGTKENDLKHVGIVESFDSTYVNTIEGNTSNMVARRKYKRTDSNIFGYCYPSYDEEKNAPTINNKSNIEIPINNNINNLNKSSKAIGIVNASELNVRSWAGSESPQLKSIPSIKQGTAVDICDAVEAKNKDKWYYILINKKTYGFVNSKYITIQNNNDNTNTKVDSFSVQNTR